MAKLLHLNVVISPRVQGDVSLYFDRANPKDAFAMLLSSHGLIKSQRGNVWYIASREELITEKENELKWQTAKASAESLITQIWQIKYAKAEEVAHLFQKERGDFLSKRGRLYVDSRTNSICIQDTKETIQLARALIKRLDVPVEQMAIYVRLIAIDSDCERELGISFIDKQVGNEKQNLSNNYAKGARGRYTLAIVKLADRSLLDIKLSALERKGRAELISSPSLFTANQQLAFIEAGEEVPYQEVSESGGTGIAFKKAVLGLRVTPQVLPHRKILLQLQINQDRPSNKMILGMPTISTRQIMTNVLIKDGQTIVLGGIYETNKENAEEHVPFISEIPIIGLLFKQHERRINKRELLIFVTPRIIA
jgi:type IV pilus assembly protein PilQ